MRDSHDRDAISWIILVVGILLILLSVWAASIVMVRAESNCAWADCTGTRWVLKYDGETIENGDMTEEECAALKDEIDPQLPPFSRLECVSEDIARQDS